MHTFWDRLYLIDFGIARRYRVGQLRDTGSLGSPGYAAPEQYGRAQTTTQTDIYGLGATLQTLLTGKEPLEIRLQGMPQDAHIPQKLQALISQMMDPDPFRRPLMIEVKRSLMPYISPFRSPQWSTFLFVYTVPTFIYQSGFGNSSFLGPYFLLVLALIVSFCTIAPLRIRRAAQVRLSLKATMLIVWKQLRFSLLLAYFLTGWVCLLYAILARPPIIQESSSFLWFLGAIFIIGQLFFLIVWLKRRREMRQPSQAPTLQQMLPMQQQGQKRP